MYCNQWASKSYSTYFLQQSNRYLLEQSSLIYSVLPHDDRFIL